MIQRRWFIFFVGTIILIGATIYFEKTKTPNAPDSKELASSASAEVYRGPLDDCLQNSYIYARTENLKTDCTLNYVHFYPSEKFPEKPNKILKIGSFNLYHLGDNQSLIKNLPLVAKIMNQWDLVGAQELMPLPSDTAMVNQKVFELVVDDHQNLIKFPYDDWKVVEPGYLRLLKELQKLDPSWALILQANPEGEGSSGEMAGFYYRSRSVQLLENDHCPRNRSADIKTRQPARNLGCLVQVLPAQRKLMSRVGFSAFFKSGNFDFVGITTHIRFRPADLPQELAMQRSEICQDVSPESTCKPPKDTVGRFYEVKAIADQIEAIKSSVKDNDVIFMGDFNLELGKKDMLYWNASLKNAHGYKSYQTQPTTLSLKGEKLNSNYDHFLIDSKASEECDLTTIRSFDFTKGSVENPDPVLKEVGHQLLAESIRGAFAANMDSWDKLIVPMKNEEQDGVRSINEIEKEKLSINYKRATMRMVASKFGGLLELISDHIPIEMTCRTDMDAD